MEVTRLNLSLKRIVMIGLLAAGVFVASALLQIPIPTPVGQTRLHMGNVLCLLSGILLGPLGGGFAAGLGSALFDLTNPAYIASAPFTFIFKFFMGWVCGLIAWRGGHSKKAYLTGAILGSIAYVICYLFKSFVRDAWVRALPMEAVWASLAHKGAISITNALISVIVVVPLALTLRPTLRRFLEN